MQLPLTFRPLADPICKKILRAFREDAGWDDRNGHPGDSTRAGARVQWVSVECGKKRIGIARLELAPPEFCYLSDLIVVSAYHGQGVGQWFLKNIEQYCAQFGVRRLLLQPVGEANGFYEKMQFVADPYVPTFLRKEINPFQKKVFAAR